MSEVAAAYHELQAALDKFRAAAESHMATDQESLSVLTVTEGVSRQLDQITVTTVATLQRRGTFSERGYRKPAGALCDLLGWEWFQARRRVVAAEQACERIGLDGSVLEPRLPHTAKMFTTGLASLRHVEVIAGLLGSQAAGRLTDGQREGVEEQLAAKTTDYTPSQLRTWGKALIDALDADGAEPDENTRSVNELSLTPHRNRDGGGTVKGRFDDAAMFAAIATVIDTLAQPGRFRTGCAGRSPPATAVAPTRVVTGRRLGVKSTISGIGKTAGPPS